MSKYFVFNSCEEGEEWMFLESDYIECVGNFVLESFSLMHMYKYIEGKV